MKDYNLTLIAAIGKKNELGKNNTLIWHFKEDMKFFKNNTMGKPVIMGMNTLKSLPHLLEGREHLVLTTQDIEIPGVRIFHSKDELLDYIGTLDKECMVIGGASIYKQLIDESNRMLLTEIEAEDPEADVFFPKIEERDWDSITLSEHEDKGIKYKHLEYRRK